MRILFISDILLTGDLAYSLQEEGNEVRLCVLDESSRECYKNMLTICDDWRSHLKWVGKDGLIVFDDVGFGEEQEELRAEGYLVFGGGSAEESETDRQLGHELMTKYGLSTVPLHTFDNLSQAIRYIQKNPDAWVVKFQDGHWLKPYAYIGQDLDGGDVISVLKNYQRFKINRYNKITLQKRIFGVEIGVARYFNGEEFVGPIEYNVEHTHLFPGNIGPVVDEMGTLAWYATNENERLYNETLKKMEPYLKETDFRGNFDVNCIVNKTGAYPLEVTARLGSPIIYLQKALHESTWTDLLFCTAAGKVCDLKWREGFGVVISVVIPPFPYRDENIGKAIVGTKIRIKDRSYLEAGHIHFDEVASIDGTLDELYIAGTNGYVFYATGVGKTIAEARKEALAAVASIDVPRMFYRQDIGVRFEDTEEAQLTSWGYLT